MADNSLSRDEQRMHRHRHAVIVLARYRAKEAVKLELRAKGLKLSCFSCRDLTLMAEDYFDQHPELIGEAERSIATWPGFARWRLPPELAAESVRNVPLLRQVRSGDGANPQH
jgi:hypothetical protein